jgi:hypothetical protein
MSSAVRRVLEKDVMRHASALSCGMLRLWLEVRQWSVAEAAAAVHAEKWLRARVQLRQHHQE